MKVGIEETQWTVSEILAGALISDDQLATQHTLDALIAAIEQMYDLSLATICRYGNAAARECSYHGGGGHAVEFSRLSKIMIRLRDKIAASNARSFRG